MTSTLGASRVFGLEGPGWVSIRRGRISDVQPGRAPDDAEQLSGHLVPGFIDIQVNGVGEIDLANAAPEGWTRAGRELLAHGVTAFCPTFVSAPLDSYSLKIGAAVKAMSDQERGASVLGVHLEGPFLGTAYGAHRPEFVCEADLNWISGLLDKYPGVILMVTLAPEADPDHAAIRFLTKAGVVVALGHTGATYDESRAATDAGARAVTHLYNAMSPFHHRDPGLAGAGLDDDRLTATLIADLVHVHPAALRLAALRKTNVALISDAIGAKSDRARELGISILDGAPRLGDGTLAGSVTTLDAAVANLVSIGIPVDRAVAMASTEPAKLLGLRDRGRIEPGMRADMVLLDEDTLEVAAVWIGGELVNG